MEQLRRASMWLATVIVTVWCCFIAASSRAQVQEGVVTDVGLLIVQLGDQAVAKRDAAEKSLTEAGVDVLPALEKAMKQDNPEVAMRAKRAYDAITIQISLRAQGQDAFHKADYEKMAGIYRRLSVAANATFEDRLWQGHAWQLAGDWRRAADAYRDALKDWKPDPRNRGDDEMAGYKLGLLIARIEAREMHDPARAVKTINDTIASCSEPTVPAGRNFNPATMEWEAMTVELLQELADAQEHLGDLRGEIATWTRLDEFCRTKMKSNTVGSCVDIERVARLLARLPADAPAAFPSIFMLTPDKPMEMLSLDDGATRRRSWRPAPSPGPFWDYAFAPPAGKEFATIEFACDIEQLNLNYSGQFQCFVMTGSNPAARVSLGKIEWPKGEPAGREVRQARFDVPPGVRLVHIETGSGKGAFNVYSVDVMATFREATKEPASRPQAGAWVQVETLPRGGELTCGKTVLQSGLAYTDFKAGRYHVRYENPAREGVVEFDFLVEPGKRYGVFVNLDSPFQWSQAPLTGAIGFAPSRSGLAKYMRTTLAQLPDGSWLAAFCALDDKIGISRSKDLVTWDAAELPGFNSFFENLAPNLLRTSDGTVWLSYLSRRLALPNHNSTGLTLWLTSTRDGRTWTPLKPVSSPRIGTLMGPAMFQQPDGKCWIFWGPYGASGKSLADIRELGRPEDGQNGASVNWVSADNMGLLHGVFAGNGGVFHTTSKDGINWEAPKKALTLGDQTYPEHPKAVFQGDKGVLFFSINDDAYAVSLRLDGREATLKDCVKITNRVIPLGDSPPMLTKDGYVSIVVGRDTAWLLRAKLTDLMDMKQSQ